MSVQTSSAVAQALVVSNPAGFGYAAAANNGFGATKTDSGIIGVLRIRKAYFETPVVVKGDVDQRSTVGKLIRGYVDSISSASRSVSVVHESNGNWIRLEFITSLKTLLALRLRCKNRRFANSMTDLLAQEDALFDFIADQVNGSETSADPIAVHQESLTRLSNHVRNFVNKNGCTLSEARRVTSMGDLPADKNFVSLHQHFTNAANKLNYDRRELIAAIFNPMMNAVPTPKVAFVDDEPAPVC